MGILGDIARRDLTGNKKKEDDINHLNMENLKDYINDNYVITPYWEVIIEGKNTIKIPMININYVGLKRLRNVSFLDYLQNKDIKIYNPAFYVVPELKTALKEKYKTKEWDDYMHIYSNNDKVDNNFFINVLDFIINELGDKSITNKKS